MGRAYKLQTERSQLRFKPIFLLWRALTTVPLCSHTFFQFTPPNDLIVWMFSVFCQDRGKGFADVLDAQWECEGELIPLDLSVLNPREVLVYQHGLFLMHSLHKANLVGALSFTLWSLGISNAWMLFWCETFFWKCSFSCTSKYSLILKKDQTFFCAQQTPVISLQIASSLPNNNYFNNAFRNSFFYQVNLHIFDKTFCLCFPESKHNHKIGLWVEVHAPFFAERGQTIKTFSAEEIPYDHIFVVFDLSLTWT